MNVLMFTMSMLVMIIIVVPIIATMYTLIKGD